MKISLKKTFLLSYLLSSLIASAYGAPADELTPLTTFSMPLKSNENWSIKMANNNSVTYQGVVSYDEAGTGTGSMLYPAPNAAGLVVAVLTHGLLINSSKNAQKTKIQLAADQVLLPYKNILDNFSNEELLAMALEKLPAESVQKFIERMSLNDEETVIESAPIFFLTQDQKSIIVDNNIAIKQPGKSKEAITISGLKVISDVYDNKEISAFWIENNGQKLKEESSKLLAKSIELSLNINPISSSVVNSPFKTVRFKEGLSEKMERAQIISQDCNRLLIRNLRGLIMSVPISSNKVNVCNETPSS